jgi:hypothetical protein
MNRTRSSSTPRLTSSISMSTCSSPSFTRQTFVFEAKMRSRGSTRVAIGVKWVMAIGLLAIVACDDDAPVGPGRPTYPVQPICQWKTRCPVPTPGKPVQPSGDAGAEAGR